MTEVVLRHPDLPGQPYIGTVAADGSVTPNLGGSGWVIDLDTDPVDARQETPPARAEKSNPVTPHFAQAEEPVAPAAGPVQPAEPATSEQGDTVDPLDLEKE